MTICSRNEVSTLFGRAARAANYSWGQAEDIGQAMQCGCDFDRTLLATMTQYLQRQFETPAQTKSIKIQGDQWLASGNAPLCPLVCGMTLNDLYGASNAPDVSLNVMALGYPVLLTPFVVLLSKRRFKTVCITGNTWMFIADSDNPATQTDAEVHDIRQCDVTVISPISQTNTDSRRSNEIDTSPVEIDETTWQMLLRLAAKTYVPATDTGRLSGAGAGLNDND